MEKFVIRKMQPDDWDQVRQIYREGLSTGQASFETDTPAWEQWDQSHHRHSRLVVCCEDRIIAWTALSPVSRRDCYAGVAEFSLYVADLFRSKGVGKMLLMALIGTSEEKGIWSLYGSTFPENQTSVRM